MKRLVEFPLENDEKILVEIDESEESGLINVSADKKIVKAQQTLEKALEKVKPAANFVINQLRKLHDAPDEIEVTFGLKLSADAGAVIASTSAEANYTVKLMWGKKRRKNSTTTKSGLRKKKL